MKKAKRTPEVIAAELDARERVLLFCLGSGTSPIRAGVGNTATLWVHDPSSAEIDRLAEDLGGMPAGPAPIEAEATARLFKWEAAHRHGRRRRGQAVGRVPRRHRFHTIAMAKRS